MVNRHMPTSVRLMPRASSAADGVNTCTEAFNNCRLRRRLSGLNVRFRIIRRTNNDKLAQ